LRITEGSSGLRRDGDRDAVAIEARKATLREVDAALLPPQNPKCELKSHSAVVKRLGSSQPRSMRLLS
jgi:hypothetical protein